jgi:uncharacterized protein YndB with AHSA1/START domain
MPARNDSSEIRLTRVYDATVQSVWEAWTVPEEVAQWWGPRGFTLTTHSRDLRAGGHWHYTMHGPDGTDYENTTQYLEVEPQSRLVYDHGGHKDRPPLFRVTATFTAVDGGMQLDLRFAFATPEIAREMQGFIRKAGGESTWDRLAEHVNKRRTGHEIFVMNRSFDAPIADVFEAWTDPAQLAKWLPPAGSKMTLIRGEIKQGSSTFFVLKGEFGSMYVRSEYLAIEAPRRIVYAQQFCDEQERPSRHPGAATFPATMLTTVTLAEEGAECTRVTVTMDPQGPLTDVELATFLQARGGMTQGWGGSFDALEAVLA